MQVYIDIETTYSEPLLDTYTSNIKAPKSYKDQEAIDKYLNESKENAKSKMCVDLNFSKIRMIGLLVEDIYHLMDLKTFIDWHLEHRLKGIHYVSYNGKKFDFPVIIREMIKNGFIESYKQVLIDLKECCDRYSKLHTDLMDINGYGDWTSLDVLSQVYLGKAKEPINFLNCSDEELASHNFTDLVMLSKLHNLFKYVV